jgi:hypothetical protein
VGAASSTVAASTSSASVRATASAGTAASAAGAAAATTASATVLGECRRGKEQGRRECELESKSKASRSSRAAEGEVHGSTSADSSTDSDVGEEKLVAGIWEMRAPGGPYWARAVRYDGREYMGGDLWH